MGRTVRLPRRSAAPKRLSYTKRMEEIEPRLQRGAVIEA